MTITPTAGTAFVTERELFIGNKWRPGSTGQRLTVIDPATEQPVGSAAAASAADIDAGVAAARAAFDHGPWPRMSIQERAAVLVRFAEELEKDAEAVTELLVAETGLILGQSRGGALTMPAMLRYYAGLANTFPLVEKRVGVTGVTARIEKRPVGVVAAIVPWNAPLALAAFKLPQALLAGCTVIMKPSEDTPLSAGYFADAALRAGLPAGVLNILPALPTESDLLVRHPGIDKITFTGSTTVGRAIATSAADTLKQLTLELGGKSPAVVLDDASLQRVVDTMVPGVTSNNGEVCTNPSRLIVPEHRKDEIVGALAEAFAALVVGDPRDPKTDVGPMITRRHYERVMGYLASATEEGGRFAVGGGRPPGLDTGFYIAPTIITDVSPGARVAQEEIFGPVLTVLTYRDEEEAVRIANGTEFGLSGAVYSEDFDHALQTARKINSGTVNINNSITIDIGVPFGGVKQSGYGRELGPEGLGAFLNTHVIFLDGEPLRTL
ncbi:aldehyde dehydrogenase [Nonomuraea lactucae]|uniref:aldehyde dehydrogenase n=1 Tax=Nonomuraea lactucae TaxID=2249762 RepID=UPI0013B3BF7C|nr:aldehyde dehydrogenase [Nonomuraea lactucae]